MSRLTQDGKQELSRNDLITLIQVKIKHLQRKIGDTHGDFRVYAAEQALTAVLKALQGNPYELQNLNIDTLDECIETPQQLGELTLELAKRMSLREPVPDPGTASDIKPTDLSL